MSNITIPTISDKMALRFLDDALEAFNRAAHSSSITSFVRIAGQIIQILIAGDGLGPYLLPSLIHHQIPEPSVPPDLTLYAFDTASTATGMPPPIWTREAYTRKETLLGFNDQRFHVAYNAGSGVFNFQDSLNGVGLYWIDDAKRHPAFERSSPFRLQLYWWMRNLGRVLLHGGVVHHAEGGILLAGRGGSGKSTSTLACLDRGWGYLGDDYVMVSMDPVPIAYNLYQSAKLNNAHFKAHFSHLANTIMGYTSSEHDKAILLLDERFPGQIMAECPLQMLVFPRISDVQAPRLTPLDSRQAMTAVSASTLHQIPGMRPLDIRRMMALVQRLPGFLLEIGGDPHLIPAALLDLLKSHQVPDAISPI